MRRFRSHIALMIGSAICAVYLSSLWGTASHKGAMTLPSQQPLKSLMAKSIVKVAKVGIVPTEELNSCQCVKDAQDLPALEYEDINQCGPRRQFFENAFQKIPPSYREERAVNSSEFPRVCLLYIMNSTMGNGQEARTDLVDCPSEFGQPRRRAFKACVTPNYVNSIYNYFTDVADCMDYPQKSFLPKIFNESGFHPNAYGRSSDAGIGQLTAPAIEEANKEFAFYKAGLLASARKSCQRLAPQLKDLSPVSHRSPRCGFIAPPDNPLRNLVYMGIKYHQDLGFVDLAMKNLKIMDRMKALGLSEPKLNKDRLKQILLTLGYNTGAYSSVILLSNYLKRMEYLGRKISVKDFDFRVGINANRSLDLSKATALTFPGYLMLNQSTGSPGYVSRVRSFADELNRVFKEGTCVPESYLAL